MRTVLLSCSLLFCIFSSLNAQHGLDRSDRLSPFFIQPEGAPGRHQATQIFREYFDFDAKGKMQSMGLSDRDPMGYRHETYQQQYDGVKVEGAVYRVHMKNGIIKIITGHVLEIPADLSTIPSISREKALNNALWHVNARRYRWEDTGAMPPEGELVIWGNPRAKTPPRLAYKFDIYALDPLYRAYVYIDAHTGRFLADDLRIHHANISATGNSLYNGPVTFTADFNGNNYLLRQITDGCEIRTLDMHNGTDYSAASDIESSSDYFSSDDTGVQAHWSTEQTYQYFWQKHGRRSYDDNHGQLYSYIHYRDNYKNAFWDGERMTYGDGDGTDYNPFVSCDVVAHEITHGVIQYSANLIYQDEPGALNESFADIFGEATEFFATENKDWLIGADVKNTGYGAIRSMSDPKSFNDPDTYLGDYWYEGENDNGGVHSNSGVQNKWFYILSEGESGTNDLGNSYSVAGIGMEKAARIAYRNLTVYLSTWSDYHDARIGAIQAAIDLYGEGSPEALATAEAWYAVGVGDETDEATYCSSQGNSANYEWIAQVDLGNFSNASGAAGYTDFTSLVINVTAGQSYEIVLTPGFRSTPFGEYWKVWIDYNQDGDFFDDGELVLDAGALNTMPVTGAIHIPDNTAGETRMRISMKYQNAQSACETFNYGEVEDYTLSISDSEEDDVTPPTPPDNLTASNITETTIDLTWDPATDNIGIARYNIYVDGSFHASTSNTQHNLDGLTPGQTYSITVRAVDAAGNLSSPTSINVTTLEEVDTAPPTAPENLTASNITETTVDLTWDPATDNIAVAQYNIYVDGSFHASTSNTQYNLDDLTPGQTYSITVRALDAAGNSSSPSSISVTTPEEVDTSPPTPPENLTASNITQTTVDLTWDPATDNIAVTRYDLYIDGVFHASTTDTEYTIEGLTPGQTYQISVRAADAAGNISPPSSISILTQGDQAGDYCHSQGNNTSYEWISQVVIGAFSHASGATQYSDFTNLVVEMQAGQSYDLSLTPGYASAQYAEFWSVWVDYNQDGDFEDEGELAFSHGNGSTTTVTGNIHIPANAHGTTRMRISMKYGALPSPCENFNYGEVEDYTVSIQAGNENDTDPPTAPGNLTADNTTQTTTDLSWSPSTDNVGVVGYLVYVDGALYATTTETQYPVTGLNSATTYAMSVTAMDDAGNESAPGAITVATRPGDTSPPSEYCTSKGNDSSYEWIAEIQIGSFSNASGPAGYSDFTSQEIRLNAGRTYDFELIPGFAGTPYREYWRIWIDYNQDGDFEDDGELVFDAGASSATPVSGDLQTPADASGATHMRVSMKYNNPASSCEIFNYGEVEDYTVVFENNGEAIVTASNAAAPLAKAKDVAQVTALSRKEATGRPEGALLNTRSLKDGEVKVYPNPADHFVHILSDVLVISARLFSAEGKLRKAAKVLEYDGRIDIAGLPSGIYYLNIQTAEGYSVRKIVKR